MTPAEQQFIVSQFDDIRDRLTTQDETLQSLEYAIHGNGTPGLKTLVDRHDKTIKLAKKIMWIVLTPILAALGTGLVAAGFYLIQAYKGP